MLLPPSRPWAGVILAAGEARRMGEPKLLLPFGSRTVLGQVLWVGQQAGLAPLVVVVGHQAAAVAACLPEQVSWVENPEYRHGGMFSSVCRGLRALPAGVAMAVLLLGDQPTLTPAVVQALRVAWESDGCPSGRCYLPVFQGQRGHPLGVPVALFNSVLTWSGVNGLRGWLEQWGALREVPVEEPGILLDIDTPADYERALKWWQEREHRLLEGEDRPSW